MRIVVANTKGGSGKTTTSLFLATAAKQAGYNPIVLDTDADTATAERWALQAEKRDTPLPFPVTSANVLSLTRDYPHDLIFIDTPGEYGRMFNAAVEVADLVIVPASASANDVSATWGVIEEIEKSKQPHANLVVLLTRQLHGTKATREIIEAFKSEGQPIVEFAIPLRESINQAYGTVPNPLYDYEHLWGILAATYIAD